MTDLFAFLILKNKFKITDKEKLQLIETDHLAEAYRKAVSEYGAEHTFTEVGKYHDAIRRVCWRILRMGGVGDPASLCKLRRTGGETWRGGDWESG